MKRVHKRIFIILVAIVVTVASSIFLSSFQAGPVNEQMFPKTQQEIAPETETPQDGAVIDHPLPEDPILTNGPWASAHFLMDEYACDCAGS